MPPSQTNVYSDCFVDYLTCGGCALEFPLQNITNFIQHKKVGCLDPPDVEPAPISDGPDENALLCYTCSRDFMTARGLLQHIQLSHNLKVFLQPGEEQLQVSQREKKQAKKMPVNLKTGSVVPSVKQASVSEDSLAAEKKKSSNDDDIAQNHAVEIMSGRHQSDKQCQNNDYEQEMTSNSRTTICCNSQECCVTIIPGTHERPKKCCSAVIPKKRKQHMAEHMGNSGDQESSGHEMSDRESDQNDDNETQEDSNSNSIFIDFHPQFRSFNQNSSNRNTTQNTDRNDSHKNSDLPIATKTESFEMSGTQEMVEPSTTVIHAGKSYNIPVSYTYSLTDFRIINNKSVKIFPSMSDKQQQPNCIGPQTSSIESQMNFEVPVTSLQNKSVELECQTLPTVSLLGTGIAAETTSLYEASRETELDDSDKDYEMEIDETLQDRGRKRRYPTSRPFKCSQCDRAFNQRIHLRKHMSKHTGVKPFKCAQCSYATVERSHLKVHIRIHTGEKPFKCTFCKYATAQNSTLKIHLKRHHNGKMLECEDCHKQFTQHEMLTSHRMGHQQSKQPVMTVGTSQDRINRTATSRHWPNIVSENNT